MLWVYAGLDLVQALQLARSELPPDALDLSKLSTESLPGAVADFCDHHASGHLFLGFLDPLLMLHPTEETRMRRGFVQCTVSIVVSNPYLLPFSWKNGIERLRVIETSVKHATVNAEVVHDGGAAHVQHEAEHGRAAAQTPDQRNADQGRKARRPAKGRKQAGQDQAP